MKPFTIIICLFLLVNLDTFGQKQNLPDLNDRLFCYAYSYGQADSLTTEFLKVNFPYLTRRRPQGQLISPPIGRDAKKTITSMEFTKHPFFDFNINHGRLDFETIETPGQPKFETGADLYLFFDNKQSADSAFDQLIKLYRKVSVKENITINDTLKTAKFLGEKLEYYTPKALIKLSKDDDSNSYQIFFTNWYLDN